MEIKGGGSTEPQSLDSPPHVGVSRSQSPVHLPDSTKSKLRKLDHKMDHVRCLLDINVFVVYEGFYLIVITSP